MIPHTLLRDEGILLVSPREPLEAADFRELEHEVDPFIAERGKLQGLMVVAKRFPGWRNFAGLKSHLRFVRDHRLKVKKVAAVTDNALMAIVPRLVAPFVKPQVRRFHANERESALAWLRAN
jgi:hypothetical protein